MRQAEHNGNNDTSVLEVALRLDGTLRQCLGPLGVTPLQAGTILFVQRHPATKIKEAAEALAIRSPTLSPTIKKLIRKKLLTGQRPAHDDRAVYLHLTPQGKALARKIMACIRDIRIDRAVP